MAPSEYVDDYYSVLEVTSDASPEKLRKSYYKLAKTKHPDKGGSNEAFQLLGKALETLIDPTERRAYDTVWPSIRDRLRAQQESARQQAEAAEAERQREAELWAKKEKIYEALERKKAEARAKDQRERQHRLQTLRTTKARYDREIHDLLQDITMHEHVLEQLNEQDREDSRLDKEQTSSWQYISSFFYTSAKETNEQKQARENNRLQRVATRRFKEDSLDKRKGKLERQRNELRKVNDRISAEEDPVGHQNMKEEEEMRQAEERAKARQREKAREALEAREAQEARAQEAQRVREAREAQEAQEAREAQEAGAQRSRAQEAQRLREAREAREAQEARARAFRARRARHEQDEYRRPPFAEEPYSRQKTSEIINDYEASYARELAAEHCWHRQIGPFGQIVHPCDGCFAWAVAVLDTPVPP